MSDAFAQFINNNREAFDSYEPSANLWNQINQSMNQAPSGFTGSTGKWWIGSAVGTVVVATAIFYAMQRQQVNPDQSNETVATLIDMKDHETVAEKETLSDTYVVNAINLSPRREKETKTDVVEKQTDKQKEVIYVEQGNGTFKPVEMDVEEKAPSKPNKPEDDREPKFEKHHAPAVVVDTTEKKSKSKGDKEKTKSKKKEKSKADKEGYKHSTMIDTMFTGIRRLEIAGGSADIKFMSSDQEKLQVKGNASVEARGIHNMKNNGYAFDFRREGDILFVKAGCIENTKLFIGTLMINSTMEFHLPEGVKEVIVQSLSGDLSMDEFRGTNLKFMSSSGDIKAGDLSGDVIIKSFSGDVKVGSVVGSVKIETSSGNISLASSIMKTDIATHSGNVVVGKINGVSVIKTSSGDINIKSSEGQLRTASYSGDVNVGAAEGKISTSTSSGEIKFLNVTFSESSDFASYSGNIEIDLAENSPSDLRVEMKSYSGRLSVEMNGDSARGERELKLGQGTKNISASTSSGNITVH